MFDCLTFATLLLGVRDTAWRCSAPAWFVESLLTELVIALVVRTRRPFFRSRPGRLLLASTAALVAVALILPYVPAASLFGFVPLPAGVPRRVVRDYRRVLRDRRGCEAVVVAFARGGPTGAASNSHRGLIVIWKGPLGGTLMLR